MRVLSIGNFGTGWDGSICDEEHIAKALEGLWHDVKRLQRESAVSKDHMIWGLSWKPDFVLIQQWDGYPPEFVSMIRDIYPESSIVYWAFDYQANGQEWHERLISESDLYLSKRIADSKYQNWQWLSQDFAPEFLNKYTPNSSDYNPYHKDIDVLFTGSYLPWATERTETLKAVDKELNLTIHSVTPDAWKAQGFKNVYGPVMDDQLPQLISRAKINLSIDHTLEAGYWSDRNAQVMCCGGFVVHRYQPLCEVAFKQHVEYAYSVDDTMEKIAKWLYASTGRESRALAGYKYAQQHLKVKNRVQDLLAIVGSVL